MESKNNLQKQVGIDNENSIDNENPDDSEGNYITNWSTQNRIKVDTGINDGDYLPRDSVDDFETLKQELIKKKRFSWKLFCCYK